MPIYELTPTSLRAVPTTNFAAQSLRERDDIQRLLREHLAVLDPDLLFVAEEYALFEHAQRRIDLLAVDRTGRLVVIELKRTEDGGHMELQALRYAAMVSTMTTEHLVQVFADNYTVELDEARDQLATFVESDVFELSDDVRIVLVAAGFSQEVTATVLWLTQNYNLDISCFRLILYSLDGKVLLDVQRIIPLPEARDYQIRQRQKGAEAAVNRATGGRDFTKYDVHVGDRSNLGLSKQGAVHLLTRMLLNADIPVGVVRAALDPRRWVAVHPDSEETVEDAFRREYPDRGSHYWFDLNAEEDGASWVIPRLGGVQTEKHLSDLAKVAPLELRVRWNVAVTGEQ